MESICKNCGVSFYYSGKKEYRKYCSHRCYKLDQPSWNIGLNIENSKKIRNIAKKSSTTLKGQTLGKKYAEILSPRGLQKQLIRLEEQKCPGCSRFRKKKEGNYICSYCDEIPRKKTLISKICLGCRKEIFISDTKISQKYCSNYCYNHSWDEERRKKCGIISAKRLIANGVYTNTKGHQKLQEILKDLGFSFYNEAIFYPYVIDCYSNIFHCGFEADSEFFHDKGKDLKRDSFLLEKYKIPILRFQEHELLDKKKLLNIQSEIGNFLYNCQLSYSARREYIPSEIHCAFGKRGLIGRRIVDTFEFHCKCGIKLTLCNTKKNRQRKYCSLKCFYSYGKNYIQKFCLNCNSIFVVKDTNTGCKKKFCSLNCVGMDRSVHKKEWAEITKIHDMHQDKRKKR